MPSKSKAVIAEHLYLGIKGGVLAIRKEDGSTVWFTKLRRGMSFVPIIQEGNRLYAASGGEVSCLDAGTGAVLWHNQLKGFGTGYAALAGCGFPTSLAAMEEAARSSAAVVVT